MKHVTIVTGFTTEVVPYAEGMDILECYSLFNATKRLSTDDELWREEPSGTVVRVPIRKLSDVSSGAREDWYIAVHPDVDKLLGSPFALVEEYEQRLKREEQQSLEIGNKYLKCLNDLIYQRLGLKQASFWERMKYALTGNPRHLLDWRD